MEKLTYNKSCERMEVVSESGMIATSFLVPPILQDGDWLMPLRLEMLADKAEFFFLGTYNPKRDHLEFVLAGPRGHDFRVVLGEASDGMTEQSWQVETRGRIRSDLYQLTTMDRIVAYLLTMLLGFIGYLSSDYLHYSVALEAFAKEEVIRIPVSMLRFPLGRAQYEEQQQQMCKVERYKNAWSSLEDDFRLFSRCALEITVSSTTLD